MKALLNFLAIHLTVNHINHHSQIRTAIEEYLGETTGVGLITNNPESWQNIKFSFPIFIKSFETNTHMLQLTSYILDLRKNEITRSHLKLITRNADTKYIAITIKTNLKRIIDSITNLSLCHVQIIIVHKNYLETYPFKDRCKGIGTPILQTNGCKVNVSFLDFPPNVIFNGKTLSGFEGNMFQTVSDKIGLNLNYVNRHEKGWGQFDPPSGLQGDVGSFKSFAGFGALYAYHLRWMNADLLMGCNSADLSWAVSVGSGPTHPTWFLIFISEFSTTLWIYILITYLILIVISYLLNLKKKYKKSWALYILALILGSAQKLALPKPFTIAIVLFGMVSTTYYQTIMASKLTLPSKIPEIDDLLTLSQSGLNFYGPPSAWLIISDAAAVGHEGKKFINRSYVPTLANIDDLLPKIVDTKEVAYLRHSANLLRQVNKNAKYAGKIHIVKEASIEFTPVTLVSKYSCLTRYFQKSYTRLCDSGLGRKWYHDMTARHPKSKRNGPTKLALQHIKGFLILLACGLIGASIIFIVELSTHSITKYHSTEKLKRQTYGLKTHQFKINGIVTKAEKN